MQQMPQSIIRILAIESSCDETAAAIIDNGRHVRSNVVATQADLHKQYGGVFPEMASRVHIEAIGPVIKRAVDEANVGWGTISAIAVTKGPGLPGSLVVGMNAAKGIAMMRGLPLIGVNHLEGHIYSHWLVNVPGLTSTLQVEPRLSHDFVFPLIALIVSGGHTELILMHDHGDYELVGHTVDDAAGEAFDKVARMLGLGYPGGPSIERSARTGDAAKFSFSRPRIGAIGRNGQLRPFNGEFDFSFSGAKTAVLNLLQTQYSSTMGKPITVPVNDISASFQAAVVDWLVEKTIAAVKRFGAKAVLVGGGVSANKLLRQKMTASLNPHPLFPSSIARNVDTAERSDRAPNIPVSFPPLVLCTDNAAMIGSAAYFAYMRGMRDGLDLDVVPDLKLGV
jgi:N6-L-threonylcarbamoyladenine synthase